MSFILFLMSHGTEVPINWRGIHSLREFSHIDTADNDLTSASFQPLTGKIYTYLKIKVITRHICNVHGIIRSPLTKAH